ncbi:DNA polymerase III subunit gamma/tau [Wolbachia endosymbiont of Chironomus riparius]|uniref:DNA polymerase III subunit gamma/tau n=1 Tax=Wolbachia endosymbiont of Chironomus riparius TaxID=2883238 RepID=UPI00209EE2AB|nr:DNA polymerase III subunit gamma/tau [Wolbachia endosymbiont of Chironomus riparius]
MNIALKYRPSTFKDLIGQETLVRILENAFILGKIPQSILLCGSSGVGKTTTARIIALCLNCSLGPTFEPCGLCESCIAIKNSRHPDVIEIDAASHTGIDDIKLILGDICYLPINSKFKVYIIDEVHMLSNSAFNALLKTLEEPPPRVKFILATTEIKKIPLTIIARCQRFILNNIPTVKIVDRLRSVVQQEGYSVEKGAIELIAQHSGNSMRNALFLLNQAVLYAKNNTTHTSDVRNVLGLAGQDIIFDLLNEILNGNLNKAWMIFDKTAKSLNIFEELLHTIQLICRFAVTKEIDEVITEYEASKIKELSGKKSVTFFSRLWKVLLKSIEDIKASTCSDVSIEMTLISLCYLSDLPSPEQLVKKVLLKDPQQKHYNDDKQLNFHKILELLKQSNNIYLYKQLCNNLQLIDYRPGYLKMRAISKLDDGFCDSLKNYLNQFTMHKWHIVIDTCDVNSNCDQLPEVTNILNVFKGSKVINVKNKE